MLDYMKGTLMSATPDSATLEVGSIGYRFFIPLSTYTRLSPLGSTLTLYIAEIFREDSQRSYGFLTKDERTLFEQLSAVSGVGPKTALALIGHLEGPMLKAALVANDISLLSKVPGIGKKTAERLVLELRDKIGAASFAKKTGVFFEQNQTAADALNALTRLGYSSTQAQRVVEKTLREFSDPPELSALISAALRCARAS